MKHLTAFYDLEFGPVSYDFVTWLVRAMKERDARRCAGLHVVIVPKEDGLGGFSRHWGEHDEAATRWRLWHIVIAACPLAGAGVSLAPSREWAQRLIQGGELWWPQGKAHFMGPLVEAGRRGEAIPKLRATAAARSYVKAWRGDTPYVTLTLRAQRTDAGRNCDLPAWAALHENIAGRGLEVVTLNDSHAALANGQGYGELDPDLRLALYEGALMNCVGNNGPQELLKFSDAPYLAFGQALTEGWKDHFRKYFGLEPGAQLPWAGRHQRLVYEPDTAENLIAEFWRAATGIDPAWATATN
jgi:hypothetical protein